MTHDTAFTGSIPDTYEDALVPLLFKPYSEDMAERVARDAPINVLELAAGTGATTRELLKRLPGANITMTDLNAAMLEKAASILGSANVLTQRSDASSLPFDDGSFDVVVATFGVMFFPDRIQAYHEARRVLSGRGSFHFNAWGTLAANPQVRVMCESYKSDVGAPCFLERVPFAYNDHSAIRHDLTEGGFANAEIVDVAKSTHAASAAHLVDAMVKGSPLGADFQQLGDRAGSVRANMIERLTAEFGSGPVDNIMSAVIVRASPRS